MYFCLLIQGYNVNTKTLKQPIEIPSIAIKVHERVRWSDLDAAGILYFGNYIRLFEIGETELFRAAGHPYSNKQFDELGIWMLRVQFNCTFLSSGYIDDLLSIYVWVSRIGGASLDIQFVICRDSTMLGHGICTIVSTDRQTKKAKRIPESLRNGLNPFISNHGIQ
jgi:acyl-CoA thioester hydrolase